MANKSLQAYESFGDAGDRLERAVWRLEAGLKVARLFRSPGSIGKLLQWPERRVPHGLRELTWVLLLILLRALVNILLLLSPVLGKVVPVKLARSWLEGATRETWFRVFADPRYGLCWRGFFLTPLEQDGPPVQLNRIFPLLDQHTVTQAGLEHGVEELSNALASVNGQIRRLPDGVIAVDLLELEPFIWRATVSHTLTKSVCINAWIIGPAGPKDPFVVEDAPPSQQASSVLTWDPGQQEVADVELRALLWTPREPFVAWTRTSASVRFADS